MKYFLAHRLRQSVLLQRGVRLLVRWLVPRMHVGAVGAVFNDTGQVLLVEHAFRLRYPWGLPGGWIAPGEHPAEAVQRELAEELGLTVTVKQLLLCERQGGKTGVPPGLGLAYYCRLVNGAPAVAPSHAYEVLSTRWLAPEQVDLALNRIDRQAIALGQLAFAQEQAQNTAEVIE